MWRNREQNARSLLCISLSTAILYGEMIQQLRHAEVANFQEFDIVVTRAQAEETTPETHADIA